MVGLQGLLQARWRRTDQAQVEDGLGAVHHIFERVAGNQALAVQFRVLGRKQRFPCLVLAVAGAAGIVVGLYDVCACAGNIGLALWRTKACRRHARVTRLTFVTGIASVHLVSVEQVGVLFGIPRQGAVCIGIVGEDITRFSRRRDAAFCVAMHRLAFFRRIVGGQRQGIQQWTLGLQLGRKTRIGAVHGLGHDGANIGVADSALSTILLKGVVVQAFGHLLAVRVLGATVGQHLIARCIHYSRVPASHVLPRQEGRPPCR